MLVFRLRDSRQQPELAVSSDRRALEEFVGAVEKFVAQDEKSRALLLQQLFEAMIAENGRARTAKNAEWIVTAARDITDAAGASEAGILRALRNIGQGWGSGDILGEICTAGRD